MLYKTLGNTGLQISCISFGASPLGNVFQPVSSEECQRAVDVALASGVNLFDVSPYYGNTLAEERLGVALRSKRHSAYLATKCGRYGRDSFDFSRARVLASIDESLTRLQTDYVDLLQAHDIEFGHLQQIAEETIPALQEIKAQGKARFIGVTGYQLRMLAHLVKSFQLDTVLTYCRSNLLINDMDQLLLPAAEQVNIGLLNASPLHMGLLTSSEPPAWHPASSAVKGIARQVVTLCEEHGLSAPQVALRYCLGHRYSASTLIGMSTGSQVETNLQALELDVPPSLLQKIDELVSPIRSMVWNSGLPENADYLPNQTGSGMKLQ